MKQSRARIAAAALAAVTVVSHDDRLKHDRHAHQPAIEPAAPLTAGVRGGTHMVAQEFDIAYALLPG